VVIDRVGSSRVMHYPKIQIRTVGEMLAGTGFEVPPHPSMYQAADRMSRDTAKQGRLG